MSLVATESRDPEELAAEARALAAEVKGLKASLVSEQKQHAKVKAYKIDMEAALVRAAEAWFTEQPTPRVPKPHRDGRKKGEEVAVAFACDWHLGATSPDFNLEVAEKRIVAYAEKIERLSSIQRADHPVRRLRVWALGDLVAGENIYPGQAWEIDTSLLDQMVGEGLRIFRQFLTSLLPHFENIEVVAVPGNHGRMAPRHSPFHPDTNADRVLYMTTREAMRSEERVGWRIARAVGGETGRMLVDRIGNYACLLQHGDAFRGGNSFAGLPFYSMTKVLKWRDMVLSGEMETFGDVACGHWHRCGVIPIGANVIRLGGTLLTYDAFSKETLAASTRPQQMLLFVEPEAGRVTAEYRVDL